MYKSSKTSSNNCIAAMPARLRSEPPPPPVLLLRPMHPHNSVLHGPCHGLLSASHLLVPATPVPLHSSLSTPSPPAPPLLHPYSLLACSPTLLLPRRTIMDDPFIRNYVEDLLRKIRTQVRGGA